MENTSTWIQRKLWEKNQNSSLKSAFSISVKNWPERSRLAVNIIENKCRYSFIENHIKLARMLGALGTFWMIGTKRVRYLPKKKQRRPLSFFDNAIHSRRHGYRSFVKSQKRTGMEPFMMNIADKDSDFCLSSHEGERFIISHGRHSQQVTENIRISLEGRLTTAFCETQMFSPRSYWRPTAQSSRSSSPQP